MTTIFGNMIREANGGTLQTMTTRRTTNTANGTSFLAELAALQQDETPVCDAEAYKKRLAEKFGIRLTVESIGKDQHSLDKIGGRMCGNDVIIAPNILNEMASDANKAAYYEQKIQNFFDNIPRYTAECAAAGLTFEPCGVVIHEDGTTTYVCGGEDSPERKAKVEAANALKQKKKLLRLAELHEYGERLVQQKIVAAKRIDTAFAFMH